MDIQYLLLLQNFREATHNIFTPMMFALSKFIISFWPFAFFCLVYWAYDKKSGVWLLGNYAGAQLLNGVLKLTSCVYRPWTRDSRILPAGDAIRTSGGYSFPSGHATLAGIFYGSIAMEQRKKRRLLFAVSLVLAALTLFSRNYLGVHTPQDVIAGFFVTFFFMLLTYRLNERFFLDHSRDTLFVALGIVLCAASFVYINVKPYPYDYVAGKLIVDPEKMKPDTYGGIGALLGFTIGCFIERKFINFEIIAESKKQLTVALCALAVLYFLYSSYFFLAGFPYPFIRFASGFITMVYALAAVPFAIKKLMNK